MGKRNYTACGGSGPFAPAIASCETAGLKELWVVVETHFPHRSCGPDIQ